MSPGGIEGMIEGSHLVQDASEGPYVGLVVVRFVVENLGRHVVRRTDARARKVHRPFEHLQQCGMRVAAADTQQKYAKENAVVRAGHTRLPRWRTLLHVGDTANVDGVHVSTDTRHPQSSL